MTEEGHCRSIKELSKANGGISSHIFSGMMAFAVGIVTIVKMTRNMPSKLTDATFYSNPSYYTDAMVKGNVGSDHPFAPPISMEEYLSMMKRMAALEETARALSSKPPAISAEKLEMLDAAMTKISSLEQELTATKKVNILFSTL